MFRGFVNIWNYFSENVTALRMRDNCWGVTQRNEAMAFRGRWRAMPEQMKTGYHLLLNKRMELL